MMHKSSAIVIGAGIVGLATARALAIKGYSVIVIDRCERSIGASIRNFGMIWPIGQPSGILYERAMRTRSIWREISDAGVCWHDPVGSLHIANHPDEWQVLQEVAEMFGRERNIKLLNGQQMKEIGPSANVSQTKGGLFSMDEMIIDPKQALHALPAYLNEKYAIRFFWGKSVREIYEGHVFDSEGNLFETDLVLICNGADFETLYPDVYKRAPLTKCKLQMLRLVAQPGGQRMGPSLCGGLSLIHYKSFSVASSLVPLRTRYESTMEDYIKYGIHVMAAQNQSGEITIGDSHEYGLTPEPFDKTYINQLILAYLETICQFQSNEVMETWHGVYAKSTDGSSEFFTSPSKGVYILNALGGAGMTLSFGLAEEVVNNL